MMIMQSSENTKKLLIIHCIWVNFMVCALYLNKALLKNQNINKLGPFPPQVLWYSYKKTNQQQNQSE